MQLAQTGHTVGSWFGLKEIIRVNRMAATLKMLRQKLNQKFFTSQWIFGYYSFLSHSLSILRYFSRSQ